MIYTLAADAIVSDSLISQGGPFVIVLVVLCAVGFAAWKTMLYPLVQAIVQVSGNITTTTANLLKISENLNNQSTKNEMVLTQLTELYRVKRAKVESDPMHQT